MVKRDRRYMVPNGTLKLVPGDRLLVIQEDITPDSKHA